MSEVPTTSSKWNLSAAVAVLAVIALVMSVIGIAFASEALNKSEESGSESTTEYTKIVTLTEYKINPATITVALGGSVEVSNNGTMPHTLAVKDQSLRTEEIQGGGSTTLDLSTLKAGDYTVICDIPGHDGLGMTAKMTITSESGSEGDGHSTGDGGMSAGGMSADEMDEMMAKRTNAFLKAATSGKPLTKGVGAQILKPTILSDGTKQFNLTAKIVDWEVEPGKTVKAWAYNGTVPGPTIKVNVGDKVRVRLKNELPESTVIHFHGVQDIPNNVDGVPDVTQPPIKPGKTYDYNFVTKTQSVGMYHSHHNAQVQVPNGLLGPFIVGEVPTPNNIKPSQEIPMVLNDAGTIGFSLNGKSFPATAPIVTKKGEWIEIHYMNEGLMAHPMHTHGFQQWVIAKDGTKLDSPYYADTLNVAPGERYTVLVHATIPGAWAFHCHILTHAEGSSGMFGMVTAIVVK